MRARHSLVNSSEETLRRRSAAAACVSVQNSGGPFCEAAGSRTATDAEAPPSKDRRVIGCIGMPEKQSYVDRANHKNFRKLEHWRHKWQLRSHSTAASRPLT